MLPFLLMLLPPFSTLTQICHQVLCNQSETLLFHFCNRLCWTTPLNDIQSLIVSIYHNLSHHSFCQWGFIEESLIHSRCKHFFISIKNHWHPIFTYTFSSRSSYKSIMQIWKGPEFVILNIITLQPELVGQNITDVSLEHLACPWSLYDFSMCRIVLTLLNPIVTQNMISSLTTDC